MHISSHDVCAMALYSASTLAPILFRTSTSRQKTIHEQFMNSPRVAIATNKQKTKYYS